MQTKYDAVIIGGGHNGLVAAAYLAGAGLDVLVLEQHAQLGGAAVSKQLFPDYQAHISRYAYLVSLFPDKIVSDLGLHLPLARRSVAAFTPYARAGRPQALVISNDSEKATRQSLRELTGTDAEYERMKSFYGLTRLLAEEVWDSFLQPLPGRRNLEKRCRRSPQLAKAWRALIEEPLGAALEKSLANDLLRGVVFTDAKIGLLTHPHDATLLQNRCFLYHVIGNKTGEWKVPIGGMGQVTRELAQVARQYGTQVMTNARVNRLNPGHKRNTVEFEANARPAAVDARFVLVNAGANVLAQLTGRPYAPDATHEGSVFKINMLCRRLPKPRATPHTATEAFTGTFHCGEGYEAMKTSHRQASAGQVPERIPCELYCHTLTDASILSPELREQGLHTLTLFALDVPWRLFPSDPAGATRLVEQRCLAGLNQWLAEPIEDCLARDADGKICLESKSPVDLERELGLYRGNIFQGALQFPFAERPEDIGSWGVETEYVNVFLCGASARRGGGVSGIPGHNAAMKVLAAAGRLRSQPEAEVAVFSQG